MADTTTHDAAEKITVHTVRASAEEPSSGEDVRPEFTAESLSRGMRIALLVGALLGAALMVTTMIAVFVWPEGILHLGGVGALAVGGLVILIWMLQLLFGALLENNAALGREAHRAWFLAFVLTGPVGLFFYWWIHVWPAPYQPHAEGPPGARARRRRP